MIHKQLQRYEHTLFIIRLFMCILYSDGDISDQCSRNLQLDILIDTFNDGKIVQLKRWNDTSEDIRITWHNCDPLEQYLFLQRVLPRLKDTALNNSWTVVYNNTSPKGHIGTAADLFGFRALSMVSSVNTCLFQEVNYNVNEFIMAVVKQQKWLHVILIYDQENGKEAEGLMDLLEENNVLVSVFASYDILNERTDSIEKLYQAFSNDGINVTLLCSLNKVKQIMHLINTFDHIERNKHKTAIRMRSRWLIKTNSKDPDLDLLPHVFDLDNVAVISAAYPTYIKIPQIFNITHLKETAMYTTHEDGTVIMSFDPSTLNTLVHDMDIWCNTRSSKITFNVYSLYWTSIQGRMNTLNEGNYQTKRKFRNVCSSGTSVEYEIIPDLFPNDNYGFNGRKFLLTTEVWPPFVMKETTQGKDHYTGIVMDMLKDMALSLNFSYTIVNPPDGQWGSPDSKGRWSGMIGQLHRKEVDLMVAPVGISKEREEAIDFTQPFFYDFSTVCIKLPDPSRNKWKTLISPLDFPVHCCIWVMLFGTTFILYVIERYSPTYYGDDKGYKRTYQNSFWYLFGALLTQGGDRLPEAQSARALISCWWVFSIVMVAVYSGNLVAFLTITKDHLPFDTLEEMAEQDQYTWGTIGGSLWASELKGSDLPAYKKLWAGIEKFNKSDPSVLSEKPSDHVLKVLEENYAYYADAIYMDMYRSKDCRLVTIKERINNMKYGIGLPSYSPFTDIFSNKILQMIEAGIIQNLKHKYISNLDFCNVNASPSAKSIGIIDIQSGFYVIAIGINFGLTILICECVQVSVLRRCTRKPKQQSINREIQ